MHLLSIVTFSVIVVVIPLRIDSSVPIQKGECMIRHNYSTYEEGECRIIEKIGVSFCLYHRSPDNKTLRISHNTCKTLGLSSGEITENKTKCFVVRHHEKSEKGHCLQRTGECLTANLRQDRHPDCRYTSKAEVNGKVNQNSSSDDTQTTNRFDRGRRRNDNHSGVAFIHLFQAGSLYFIVALFHLVESFVI